ncbi:MAG: hypothetical protein OEW60_05335 [Thiovulaceae bacterium]|nr:hypothetical protein [Sulfurimonadaceae bacterium]
MEKPTLSSYIIAIFELVEAEGRTFKQEVFRLLFSLLLLLVAVFIFAVGLLLLLFSAYEALFALLGNTSLTALILASGSIIFSLLLYRWVKCRL